MAKQDQDKKATPGASLPDDQQDTGFRQELPGARSNKISMESDKENPGDKAEEAHRTPEHSTNEGNK